MTPTTFTTAHTVLTQGLSGAPGDTLRTLLSAGLAITAVGVMFGALRRVAQVVAALAAAAAAVGSVFLLVVVFLGLFAAALILNVPL